MSSHMIHVLLIGDNHDDTHSIKSILKKECGKCKTFEFTSANTLSNALSFTADNHIDIFLLDISLSTKNGMDSFTRLNDFAPDIPIVVLCNPDKQALAIEAVQNGAQDYLIKGRLGWELLERVIHYAIERKQTEIKLITANERLKEADQLKNEFLSTVSHELRTPIAIMREGVSLCLDGVAGNITGTQCDLLTSTLENIDRLATLITDLLDVSKIDTEKMQLKKISFDICEIVHKVFEQHEESIKEKGLSYNIDLPDKPVKLFADAEKIHQIFSQLVDNAVRYTDPGGEIGIRAVERKQVLECCVSDTGIGIAEENVPRLFSKFQQFGRVEGPGYKGTGLGLAIVKGLVEKHGGKVWVDSALNKGTSFWFTLEKVPFPKILIVDDEKNFVEMMTKLLIKDNYRFLEAFDGEAAVEIAQREQLSLIILDMVLPGMSGYEVIGRLKQDARTIDIPILITSGFTIDTDRLNQNDDHDAIPVIPKPFEPVELRNKVKKMIME